MYMICVIELLKPAMQFSISFETSQHLHSDFRNCFLFFLNETGSKLLNNDSPKSPNHMGEWWDKRVTVLNFPKFSLISAETRATNHNTLASYFIHSFFYLFLPFSFAETTFFFYFWPLNEQRPINLSSLQPCPTKNRHIYTHKKLNIILTQARQRKKKKDRLHPNHNINLWDAASHHGWRSSQR